MRVVGARYCTVVLLYMRRIVDGLRRAARDMQLGKVVDGTSSDTLSRGVPLGYIRLMHLIWRFFPVEHQRQVGAVYFLFFCGGSGLAP